MRRWKVMQWLSLPMLLIFLVMGSSPAWAQAALEDGPPPLGEPAAPVFQNSPYPTASGLWAAPANWQPQLQPASGPARAASAPDNYGYTWDDTLPFAWMDARTGTDTGMNGASGGQHFGALDLGFSFRYYENTYTQVHIAASGFLTFTGAVSWPSQQLHIPASGEPNNVIAPYWAPLYLSTSAPTGRVYFLRGGTAPTRYFVVEWYDVAGGSATDPTGSDDLFRFEVILYENGDILFQYDQMRYTGSRYCGVAGIEDSAGTDGLTYLSWCAVAPSSTAVRFSRPAPGARVRVSPSYQSGFISPGGTLSWPVSIRNLGDLGSDTFDLTTNSIWPVSLLAADGTTPLSDTDGDGIADTGPLVQGGTVQVTVSMAAPSNASVGSGDTLALTVTSSLDTGVSKTVTLQAAVPARFAQAFRDDADGAMSLLLVQPQGWQRIQATSNAWWGYNLAVAETSEGNLLYIWQRWRYLSGRPVIVSELEYTLLDHAGSTLQQVTRLVDHSAAAQDTYDEEPVVAAAPNGTIGIAWRQRQIREVAGGAQENWNVFFAILNPTGRLAYGPLNLTQNNDWYQSDPPTYGVPRFWNVRLAATDDNHFVVTWQRESQEAPSGGCSSNCLLDDIYYAVRDAAGESLKPVTQLTVDTLSANEGYSSPAVTHLNGNRWLLAYSHTQGGMAYSVLDSQGNVVRDRSFIGPSGWAPVALQLVPSHSAYSAGRIILAWTAGTGTNPQIRYVVLDGTTYARIAGPTLLDNPAAATGDAYASLAPDSTGHAILTWMDYGWNDRHNLYYALLDGDGNLVTSPMIFLSAGTPATGSPRIETSFAGYGNTSYRQFLDVPLTYWAAGWVERLYDAGITNGCNQNPPLFCPEQYMTRAQMAVLLGRALHGAAYVPPAASGTVFGDVPASYWAGNWIEQLYRDGVTRGCASAPLSYCPEGNVTRAEMAVFLVRAAHGSAYVPPSAAGVFSDVPTSYWAAAWIEQLYRDGITTGCASAPLRYCPEGNVTRAQTALLLGRAFDVP